MTTYCDYVNSPEAHALHKHYHDNEYGFPLRDDDALFERLMLEINQAGLNWLTILKKKDNFRRAFDDFDIDKVAAYSEADRARLLADPGIIRNRLKVNAAIENAKRLIAIRDEHGSFANWLDKHAKRSLSKEEWVKLFKRTFVFTGGEIVGEFLLSTGYLPGAHDPSCTVHKRIAKLNPAWMKTDS